MNGDSRLSVIVAAYELAQRNRIATGAHLRAGRDAAESDRAPMESLYAAEAAIEKRLAREMADCVSAHLTWPWMERVRGIGPILAARLLARLHIDKAPTASSFWKYCGLSTVEGTRWMCPSCGAVLHRIRGAASPSRHRTPAGHPCTMSLVQDQDPSVRVAVRLPGHGQKRSFDAGARTLCHLIGVSFLRRGRAYREVYDLRRQRLLADHPDWTALHSHLAAMRAMEKLFLAHLWSVWAERLGRPVRPPYEVARRGRAGVLISPWEMVEH